MNLSWKKIHIFPCFYFCIGSKITETVNYVIIFGGIVGERQQQKKLVKMQHYKFLFVRFVLDFCFLGNEGQGLWLLLNESSGLFSGAVLSPVIVIWFGEPTLVCKLRPHHLTHGWHCHHLRLSNLKHLGHGLRPGGHHHGRVRRGHRGHHGRGHGHAGRQPRGHVEPGYGHGRCLDHLMTVHSCHLWEAVGHGGHWGCGCRGCY